MGVGIYVHVPFCERVCPYCDFAVVGGEVPAALERRYVDAVLRELDARAGEYAGRALASLYLGGGTPSLLTPASVARIRNAALGSFASAAGFEFTLEVNPSTVERSRLPGFREAGVNRVSVGVQSFDDALLHRLGRAHRSGEAHTTLRACREAGFDALSIDLIIAAPGQQMDQLEGDLAHALDHAPDHVSTYELTIEPGTPFALAHSRGQLQLPGEALALAMIERTESTLSAAGFARYELSNYARPGREAVHNRRYWQRLPVMGIGMGAFSTLPPDARAPFGRRRANSRQLATYLDRIEAGRSPAAEPDEIFDAPTARGEAVFLALRGAQGVDSARFADEFGSPPRAHFAAQIDRLCEAGLLAEDPESGDLRLTRRGRALADSVFAEFVS